MFGRVLQGLIAGYGATAVMDTSQATVIPAVESLVRDIQQAGEGRQGAAQPSEGHTGESSPDKVARWMAEVLGVQLDREQVEIWGSRVHWAYGTQFGVVYGLLAPRPGWKSGLAFGTALWLFGDELMLWGLGLANRPDSYPISAHAKALAAHCFYGLTLGLLTRGLRC